MNVTLSKPYISDKMAYKGSFMPALLDLEGQIFGRLTVKKRCNINSRNRPAWECQCKCGREIIVSSKDLRCGDTKSCGCLRKDLLRIDILGNKFGKLKVIGLVDKEGKSSSQFWLCKCDCGGQHIVSSQHLQEGHVTHCKECTRFSEAELRKRAIERFHESYDKKNGCWIWKKSIIARYGAIFFNKTMKAHRFSYLIFHGKINDKKIICHTCDNPLCVNPDHLYEGTAKDNHNDMISRGRFKPRGKSFISC